MLQTTQEVANDMAEICHVIRQWRTPLSHSISWHVLHNFISFYNCRLKKF